MSTPTGRPSGYSEEIALAICARVISGASLKDICRAEEMPHEATVYRWMAAQSTFCEAIARARAAGMESWAEEMREIADDGSNDFMDRINKDGSKDRVLDNEHVQRSKLRLDTMKWLMSKFAPRRFGDKIEVELSGAVKVEAMSDADVEAKAMRLLMDLGVDVGAPLLLVQDDTESEPAPAVDGN